MARRVTRTTYSAAPATPKKEITITPCSVDGCPRQGCFGIGPPMLPTESWWCHEHLPEDYWRARR